MITENLSTLKIHKLSQDQYKKVVENGNVEANALYLTPTEDDIKKHNSSTDAHTDIRKVVNNNTERIGNLEEDLNKSESQYDIKEASGNVITVNDSAAFDVMGLKLFGKTEQNKTNGYQLFDASALINTNVGGATITNNGDGSFTISGNGTLTSQIATNKTYTHEETIKILRAGNITLNRNGDKVYPYAEMFLTNSNGVILNLSTSSMESITQTITQDILDDETTQMNITINGATVGNTIVPGTIKPMLYQDGDGTWEPFTGGKSSPNPEYEQKLESVGKMYNLFNAKNAIILENGECCRVEISVKENTNYTISFPTILNAIEVYTDIYTPTILIELYNNTTLTFNSGNNTKLTVQFKKIGDVLSVDDKYMINEGTTALPYKPYNGQMEIENGVFGKNLFDVNEVRTWESYGNTNINYRTKTYHLKPNTEYICATNVSEYSIIYFGESTSFIGNKTYTTNSEGTIEVIVDFDKIANYEVMICEKTLYANIYEPCTKQSLTTLVSDGLKGIQVTDPSLATYTDEDGVMWCADYIDYERGVKVQRCIKLSSKELGWSISTILTDTKVIAILGENGVIGERNNYSYCNITRNYGYHELDSVHYFTVDTGARIYVPVDYDVDANPIEIVAILQTPIEIPLTDEEIEAYKALHTNNPCTTITNNCNAHTEVKYAHEKYDKGIKEVMDRVIDNKIHTSLIMADAATGANYKLMIIDGKVIITEVE